MRAWRRSRTAKACLWLVPVLVTVVLVLSSGVGLGGFTGSVSNEASRFSSGIASITDQIGSASCSASGATDPSAACSQPSLPAVAGMPGQSSSTAVTLTNSGSVSVGLQSTIDSCATRQVIDAQGNDTGLPIDGITYGETGPSAGTSAIGLNSSPSGTDWIETTTSYNGPQDFSVGLFFDASSLSSGAGLIGFGNAQATGSSTSDRMLWIDDSGHLVWGVDGWFPSELTSSTVVTPNSWHFVLVSFSQSSRTVAVYLDGTKVLSSRKWWETIAGNYTGWWHLGEVDASGWQNAPTDPYFQGMMAGAFYETTPLSATDDTALYANGSFANFAGRLDGIATPTAYWSMQDSGQIGYQGSSAPSGTVPDESGNGNVATISGGVALADGVSPLGGGAAYQFNGSNGSLLTSVAQTNPQVFSQSALFELPAGESGPIMGFSDVQATSGLKDWDRAIWVDRTGHLVAAVWPHSTIEEIVSPSTYNDGSWHEVTVTLGSGGFDMYVDGALVASNPSVTSAQIYDGYWHVGWGGNELTSWTDPPASLYFPGDLAGVAVYPTALSPTTAESLSSPATYDAEVMANGPSAFWNWSDSSPACGAVEVSVTTSSGSCVLAATGCTTPSPLSSVVKASSATVALSAGQAVSFTQSVTTPSGLAANEVGLLAFGTQSFRASTTGSPGWTVSLTHPYQVAVG